MTDYCAGVSSDLFQVGGYNYGWTSARRSFPPHGQRLASIVGRLLHRSGAVSREPSEVAEIWKRSAASTVCVPPGQIDLLERVYAFVCRPAVVRFIQGNTSLVSLLVEAYDQVRRHFPSAQLFLEVVADPEVGSGDALNGGEAELVLSIATQLDPTEALAALDNLDNEWWLSALPGAQGKLSINLEFR